MSALGGSGRAAPKEEVRVRTRRPQHRLAQVQESEQNEDSASQLRCDLLAAAHRHVYEVNIMPTILIS